MTQDAYMENLDRLNRIIEVNKTKGLKPYIVSITEILNRCVIVFAPDSTGACELIQDKYWGGDEIVLTSDDYVDTDFDVAPAVVEELINKTIYMIEEENEDE